MTADEIKSLLHLEPHPVEGGSFRRTYTSAGSVELPRGVRAQGTAIYYLLEAGTFSEMHVLASDEIFHFYLGDPVEMLHLLFGRELRRCDIWTGFGGRTASATVGPGGGVAGRRGWLKAAKLALLGCTVTPGFDFADYRSGSYAELAAKWPAEAERIRKLTRR